RARPALALARSPRVARRARVALRDRRRDAGGEGGPLPGRAPEALRLSPRRGGPGPEPRRAQARDDDDRHPRHRRGREPQRLERHGDPAGRALASVRVMSVTAYLAPEGFEADLEAELGDVEERYGRLMIAPGPPREAAWAQNVWLDPVRVSVASIKDAARALRAVQRNWALYSHDHHRRAALIQAELPVVKAREIEPYSELPTAPLGSWTLLDRDTLLYAA